MSKKVLILIILIAIVVLSSAYFYIQKFLLAEKNIQKTNEEVLTDKTNNNEVKEDQKEIIIDFPEVNQTIDSPLTIKGKARGSWFFEASFPVILTDWDGKIITESYAQAKEDWMTNDFVPFEAVVEFKSPVFQGVDENHFSRKGYLIFQKDNPSGLPEYDDSFEIPIRFK
jgi:hypothetical protein